MEAIHAIPPHVLLQHKHSDFTLASDVWKCITPILIQHSTRRIVNSLSNLQPIGRAFALVQPASDRTALTSEPVKSTEEQVEVIKVGVAYCLFFWGRGV